MGDFREDRDGTGLRDSNLQDEYLTEGRGEQR